MAGLLCPLSGELKLCLIQCGLGRGCTSVPSGVFIHPAVWPQPKWAKNWGGGSAPFLGKGAGSPSNTKSPGPRPTSIPTGILIHPSIWPLQIWAENWGAVPLWMRGSWVPVEHSVAAGPRPTCVPSFVLIHPTVWSQCTTVTDRQDGTGQRYDCDFFCDF